MSTLYNTTMQVGVTLFFGHFNELWPLTNSSVINAALRLKRLPTPGLGHKKIVQPDKNFHFMTMWNL